MTSKLPMSLPPMAPFPEAAWRSHMMPEEWTASLDAWIALAEAHLSLSTSGFKQISCQDQSIPKFLVSFIGQAATTSLDISSEKNPIKGKRLRRIAFFLSSRLLEMNSSPSLLSWEFLSDFSKVYGKTHASKVASSLWSRYSAGLEKSFSTIKLHLVGQLEAGLKGDPTALELQLKRINHLLHASSEAAAFFMTGTDFVDSLVSCYKLMNPPLRSAIISTTYICLVGLAEGPKPRLALLTEQLYSLKASAEAHKAGPLNERESLVAELVTVTPILHQLQLKVDPSIPGSLRAKPVITALESFRKGPGDGKGGSVRPKHLIKRKVNKGKGMAASADYGHGNQGNVHIHRMSLISQIQDLFPDLGDGFVMKLLDEYNENTEEVISHLLEDSLPPHLQQADRSEALQPTHQTSHEAAPDLAPRSTPPLLPTRRNVFDDDEFDRLAVSADRLHLGKRNPGRTAESLLSDRTSAPGAAAILSALAAFDSDDDERDDTYDVEDVGGTVDSAAPGGNQGEGVSKDEQEANVHEEVLFRAYKLSTKTFDRDSVTRRGAPRASLKEETGMTDEAIEGWALMLSRDPRRLRRLEAKLETFAGQQNQLSGTRWQNNNSETEDSGPDGGRGGSRGRGRGRRGRGGGGGGGGRGRGNVAGPTGDKDTEKARNHKEANKGSRANHNRRDQRAKKMARGGFPG